mmetsp:Transcript_16515/g.21611  ORF Transcript_16515/g.21611 Transcript_16515/m.21611 type:complete len:204 (-) Transcript_16515:610-1221(-)
MSHGKNKKKPNSLAQLFSSLIINRLGRLPFTQGFDLVLQKHLSLFVLGQLFSENCASLATQTSELVRVGCRHNNGTSHGITKQYRDHVTKHDITPRKLGLEEHGSRHDKQVGDRMLQSNSNKCTNGEPDTNELSDKVVGSTSQKDGNTDHPVAEDGLDKVFAEGRSNFSDSSLHCQIGGSSRQATSVPGSISHDTAANNIASQ